MKMRKVTSTTPISDPKVQLLVAVAALAAAYYRMPLTFLLLILYLSYLLWSYYWTMMSSKFTTGESSATANSVFAGETLTREFKFLNSWLFPLVRCGISFVLPSELTFAGDVPQELQNATSKDEALDLPGQVLSSWEHSTVSYAWLPEKKEVSLRLTLKAELRGIYYIPAPQLFVGDPSGLFKGMSDLGEEQFLYVFPKLKSTNDVLKTLAIDENHREDIFGLEDRYSVQGVRDYQLTDSPKSINWYATARSSSLKTNLYARKDSECCLIAFDMSASGQPLYDPKCERVKDNLLEEAISMAAGIALFHIEQGARVAFYTNAPIIKWEKRANPPKGSAGAYMRRIRQITTLDFAEGNYQAQNILKFCAAIDGNSRAYPEDQEKLWSKVLNIPNNTIVYLIGYHNPPAIWEGLTQSSTDKNTHDPMKFYTMQRLTSLSSARVRYLNLSIDLPEKAVGLK